MRRPHADQVASLEERRDRHVIGRITERDQDAFAELFRRYGPAAYGLALRVLGDAALAEDVLQEVFLSVWRNADGYDAARGSVRAWLLMQVHRRSVDAVRREESERRRTIPGAATKASETDDVVEEEWLRSLRSAIRTGLDSLTTEQRMVIELAYFQGLTQTETASHLGVPLGTVKSRTLTAMRRLREQMISAEMRP